MRFASGCSGVESAIAWGGRPIAADGPRYEAIGNAIAVPVLRWLGERIRFVDAL